MLNFHEAWLPYKDCKAIVLPSSGVMAWAWIEKECDKSFNMLDEKIILYTATSNTASYLKKFNNSLLSHAYGISGARSIYEKFIYKKHGKIELREIPLQLYWNFAKISKADSPTKHKNIIVAQYKEMYKKYPLCCNTDRWSESDI